MSILPSKDLGSTTSSSSSIPKLSPNPNHGIPSTSTIQALQSLAISDSIHNFEGSMVPVTHRSGGSSREVNKLGEPPDNVSSVDEDVGINLGHGDAVQTEANSAQSQGSSSASAAPTKYQNDSASANVVRSNKQLAARKTQMVSGNHLLNFHYDPISRSQPRALPPRRQSRRKNYNKDLFLQANYKFVVLDTGEYTLETMDPDKKLQWEDIICVKNSTPFPVQCPICLGNPLCPQITACGHIFCFPCILQYFTMDQDDHRGECWKKCPLCFTMISPKDLYTIYIENVKQYSVGDSIEFILLTRQKDSFTLSLKHNEGPTSDEEILHSFSKFTLTSDVDLSVREAIADLDNWLARADSGLVDDLEKLPYVCAAMEQLEQRKKNWNKHQIPGRTKTFSPSSSTYGSPPTQKAADTVCKNTGLMFGTFPQSNDETWPGNSPPDKMNGKSHVVETAVVEQVEGHTESSCDVNKINNKSARSNDFISMNDKNSYSFYQAADGQHIILHSLNMKCLLHHYGSSDRIPNRITGKILQMETVNQSEATRKRYRYLSHISLTTAYQLCEIDLSYMVPPAALFPFMDEIKNREKQRKLLVKKERQEKIKAESAGLDLVPLQYDYYDIAPESSFYGSPSFSMDDFEALGSSNVVSSSPPSYGERQLFSSVARLGFAAGHDSPGLKKGESESLPQNGVPVTMSGSMSTSSPSFASITSRTKPEKDPVSSKLPESGKKGKKPSRVLLSTAGGRRY